MQIDKSKFGLLFLIFLVGPTSVSLLAQRLDLYMPLDIQKAYENGTRSYDGTPGSSYWQNRSDYAISVELIPDSSLVVGTEEIAFQNNSPDSLSRIVMRLYPNYFEKGMARQYAIATNDLTEGVNIKYVVVNGDSAKARSRPAGTNLIIPLAKKLTPGNRLTIRAGWSFKVPRVTRLRMGRYSDTDFFIAYWFPQVAVYDDINGWDMQQYLGPAEFYNDFGNFDVKITVPGDYLVWATGVLQNPDEVLKADIVKRYEKAKISDEVIQIVTPEDYRKNNVTPKSTKSTWHFMAEYVSDFSFCTSNHYRWDGASVIVDPATGRRALTDAVYPDSTKFFDEAAFFSRATIEYLSNELPGMPYPYPHITSFCNGSRSGGMETPMMTNDGAPSQRVRTIGLVFHEIAHSYFPFYMGINERKYAWMDEGWATFLPREVVNRLESKADYQKEIVASYREAAGKEIEMPMMTLTYLLGTGAPSPLRTASYSRPAIAYNMLQNALGDELFKKALQEYIKRWHGKHPIPYDFFFTFDNIARENLSWFWKPWFFERGYPDLAIKSVKEINKGTEIIIEKVGKMPIPISMTFVYEDGSEDSLMRPVTVWKDHKEVTIAHSHNKKLTKVTIGNAYIPDVNDENNSYEIKKMTN